VHAPISLLEKSLRAGKLQFCRRIPAPKLAGLQHLGRCASKGQSYGSPKNGHSEANRLAIRGCQSLAMLRRNCRALRPRLEKVCRRCGGNSDYFSSNCPSLSVKTISKIIENICKKIVLLHGVTAHPVRAP
jgi:hypothetical protein